MDCSPINARNGMNGKQQGFTLIELMVVIAIIAILASITIPVIGRAMESARRANARTDLQSIETAVRAYYNEYGRFPHDSGGPDRVYEDDNYELLNALRARDSSSGNPNHEANPRRIIFLEVPERSLSSTGDDARYIDPWGTPYRIAVDTNFDGDVDTGEFGVVRNRRVAAWSLGEEKTTETAIRSWE